MEHECPHVLPFQRIDPLFVVRGPQRDHSQTLGLAPGENRRAVCPWQRTDLAGDRTNIGRTTSIRPRPFLQDHVTNFRIFQLMEH